MLYIYIYIVNIDSYKIIIYLKLLFKIIYLLIKLFIASSVRPSVRPRLDLKTGNQSLLRFFNRFGF